MGIQRAVTARYSTARRIGTVTVRRGAGEKPDPSPCPQAPILAHCELKFPRLHSAARRMVHGTMDDGMHNGRIERSEEYAKTLSQVNPAGAISTSHRECYLRPGALKAPAIHPSITYGGKRLAIRPIACLLN